MPSNPNIYSINFDRESKLLTPPIKRQSIYLSWIGVLISHLNLLNTEILVDFRERKFDQAKYTAQHITFEGALNQEFEITLPPFIFITENVIDVDFFFIADQADPDQSFIGESPDDGGFIGVVPTLNETHYDINVPIGAGLLEEQIRSFADTIDICGVTYEVKFF